MRYLFIFFVIFIYSNDLFARAVDGDSLIYEGKKIRLTGIDAPEYNQKCLDESGNVYECGQMSKQYLAKISEGKINCKKITKDKYDREVAVCKNGDIVLNREMVRSGWAIAYRYFSDDYVRDEEYAKKHKLGIWRGRFISPRSFRKIKDKEK